MNSLRPRPPLPPAAQPSPAAQGVAAPAPSPPATAPAPATPPPPAAPQGAVVTASPVFASASSSPSSPVSAPAPLSPPAPPTPVPDPAPPTPAPAAPKTHPADVSVSAILPEPDFVLGVDLDGVCADYISGFRSVVAKIKGVPEESLTPDVSWGCREWGIASAEEFDSIHRQAVLDHDMLLRMKPLEGVVDALWRISDAGVWIRIVTHRLYVNWGHEVTAGHTVRWLDETGIPYRDLCFVAKKTSVAADAFVEDAPHNIADLRSAGRKVIIFDQPYNQQFCPPRARNWKEAEKLVRDLVVEHTGAYPLQLPGLPAGSDRLERRKLEAGNPGLALSPDILAAYETK